jgi:hypothetical protein
VRDRVVRLPMRVFRLNEPYTNKGKETQPTNKVLNQDFFVYLYRIGLGSFPYSHPL